MSRLGANCAIGAAMLVGGGTVAALAGTGHGWVFAASMATAYTSLIAFAIALGIGPWRVLRGIRSPVSITLRRDLGIWSALLAIAHVVFGLNVHLGGRIAEYFFHAQTGSSLQPRLDAFGLANDTGLVATLVMAVLLAISNQRALRALGAARWKSW